MYLTEYLKMRGVNANALNLCQEDNPTVTKGAVNPVTQEKARFNVAATTQRASSNTSMRTL